LDYVSGSSEKQPRPKIGTLQLPVGILTNEIVRAIKVGYWSNYHETNVFFIE
jgi:hypothetical protein